MLVFHHLVVLGISDPEKPDNLFHGRPPDILRKLVTKKIRALAGL
jgi:hypothetical protein